MREKIGRRQMVKTTSFGMMAALGMCQSFYPQPSEVHRGTIRDRLWLFACAPNVNYQFLHRRSLMTPAEGAYYLSIPNVIIVQSDKGLTPRFEPPFDQYAIALRPLKRVAWSIVGSGGETSPEERADVIALAKRTPNFTGVYLDDFFGEKAWGTRNALTVEELRDVRQQLKSPDKKLDMNVTFYDTLLDLPLHDYLELIDVLTFWTYNPADLANLDSNLVKLEQLAPHSRLMLGCYIYDFDRKQPISVPAMKLQCETGLRWLRQGRIEGMVFLGNTVEDVGFECVDWARNWICDIGDDKLEVSSNLMRQQFDGDLA